MGFCIPFVLLVNDEMHFKQDLSYKFRKKPFTFYKWFIYIL